MGCVCLLACIEKCAEKCAQCDGRMSVALVWAVKGQCANYVVRAYELPSGHAGSTHAAAVRPY